MMILMISLVEIWRVLVQELLILHHLLLICFVEDFLDSSGIRSETMIISLATLSSKIPQLILLKMLSM